MEPGIFPGGVLQNAEKGPGVAAKSLLQRRRMLQNQRGLFGQAGQAVIQRIQIPAIVVRQAQKGGERGVQRLPVGDGRAVLRQLHGVSSP